MGIDKFYLSDFRSVMFGDDTPYFEEKIDGKEYTYESNMGSIKDIEVIMKVYSSVHAHTEQARDTDQDSIKVKFETTDENIIALNSEKYKKITRQHGWEYRLKEYIRFLQSGYPKNLKHCSKCNRPMLLRNKNGSWFAGCSGWSPNNPDCENIENI